MDEHTHWYYLHTNGALIHKRTDPGEDDSPFVRRVWTCDPTDRMNAWTIILEALALGANAQRVAELAKNWSCDPRDLVNYLVLAPKHPSAELRGGLRKFLSDVLNVDPEAWFDWLASTPKGGSPDFTKMPQPVPSESALSAHN